MHHCDHSALTNPCRATDGVEDDLNTFCRMKCMALQTRAVSWSVISKLLVKKGVLSQSAVYFWVRKPSSDLIQLESSPLMDVPRIN